jgi:hypothetical protein
MKNYLKYLILILVIVFIALILVFGKYNLWQKNEKTQEQPTTQITAQIVNYPKSLPVLKPQNFPIINSSVLTKDEISISPSNFEQQLFFYISNDTPQSILDIYEKYFKDNGWVTEKNSKDNVFLINAYKDGLKLDLNISPDKLFNKKTFVGSIFTDKTKQYKFDEKNDLAKDFSNIRFYYSVPDINFVYKENFIDSFNRIEAQYESYLDKDTLYNLYYNQLKTIETIGWKVENIKSGVVSKRIIKVSKSSKEFLIDIGSVLVSKNNLNQRKTLVTIYYTYK